MHKTLTSKRPMALNLGLGGLFTQRYEQIRYRPACAWSVWRGLKRTENFLPYVVAESKKLFCTSCHKWWLINSIMNDSPFLGRNYAYGKIPLYRKLRCKVKQVKILLRVEQRKLRRDNQARPILHFQVYEYCILRIENCPATLLLFLAFSFFYKVIRHDSPHVYLPVDHWKQHLLRIICFGGQYRNLYTQWNRSIKREDRNLRTEALKVMMNKNREIFLTQAEVL